MEHWIHLKNGQSLAQALASAPVDGRLHILFAPGIWREKVRVDRADVTFRAERPGTSVIVFDDHNGFVRDGRALGTGDSATLTIAAPSFRARGMTFTNGFDYIKARDEMSGDPGRQHGTQAVAFRTIEGADDTVCESCTFIGWQDTLFCDVGSHCFSDCRIMGNIDFIFGAGIALFDSCTIVSRFYPGGEGYVCAPSTKERADLGFCFLACRLEKETVAMPSHSVWLGRPWHPGGAVDVSCAAVFLSCEMEDHIKAEGWTSMHSRTKDGVERTWYPQESRFFEHGSRGPGAKGSGPDRRLVPWEQAEKLRRAYLAAVGR
jgi:pectinesterase